MSERSLKPGWKMVKFGEVVHLNTEKVADPLTSGIERYVGLEHLTPEDLHIHTWGQVAEGTTFTNYFKPGQVLFGKRRAYQRKVAVADFEGVCSGDIYVFEPKDPETLLPELLPFLCQTEGFYEYAVGTSAGSLSPRTNWSQLANYEFPLPPLDEQRRVAEVLWAAEEVIERNKLLLKSLITAEESYFENVLSLCNKSQTVKRLLPEFTVFITDGDHFPPHRIPIGIPHIVVKNIINGVIDLSDCTYISVDDYERVKKRYTPQANDLLVTCVGTIGRLALVPEKLEFSADRSLIIVRFDTNKVLPEFGYELFRTKIVQNQLTAISIGSAQKHLFLKNMRRLLIAVPPINDQKQILEKSRSFHKSLSQSINHIQSHINLKKELIKTIFGQ
jgi:type I restriction enzyme S subunit